MRNNKYIRTVLFATLFSLAFAGCDDLAEPLVNELDVNRVFSPTGLTAKVRNLTTIELDWDVREDADHYVVEFSEDSLAFTNIVRTVTVTADELPLQQTFDGETRYSVRVKAVSEGLDDSKWVQTTLVTDLEDIFLPVEDGDIDALTATLRWPANSEVTRFVINPGNTERLITADEIAAGTATITGLSGDTEYTVVLYKGTKQRGSITFTTLIDVGDATRVYPEDDLSAIVAAASSGDVLVLYPGEYLAYTGILTIDKPLSIRGLYPYNKPVIHNQITLQPGAGDVAVADLDMDGTFISPVTTTETILDHAFTYGTSGTYGTLTVTSCNIHDYGKSLAAGSSSVAAEIAGISFDDCVVTNVQTISADLIDFRASYVASVTLTNSTFNKCAPARDFIRLDAAAGLSGTGKTTTVLVDHCTIYASSNTQDRIVYVRFVTNSLTVKNTLIAGTDGYYTNQTASTQPVCTNNNYFNAAGFYTDAYVAGAKIDVSGNYTTLDPGFTNASAGDFTLSNQTLIDNAVGDPRWRP